MTAIWYKWSSHLRANVVSIYIHTVSNHQPGLVLPNHPNSHSSYLVIFNHSGSLCILRGFEFCMNGMPRSLAIMTDKQNIPSPWMNWPPTWTSCRGFMEIMRTTETHTVWYMQRLWILQPGSNQPNQRGKKGSSRNLHLRHCNHPRTGRVCHHRLFVDMHHSSSRSSRGLHYHYSASMDYLRARKLSVTTADYARDLFG